ncbi:MAG: SH3 domain-containing protein [Oceanospirillaceae bacterium]|nr:SH3 domain-containing protein [Oceanospirillaceae bacterium]
MINSISSLAFSLALILASTSSIAESFFSNLKESEVQKIFDQADQSKDPIYLTNSSDQVIPAVQILPRTDSPQTSINAATQCIKLYSCNQSICLVGINNIKYATSEVILNKHSQLQADTASCSTHTTAPVIANINKAPEVQAKKPPVINWVKVKKVKSNDTLNVRQRPSYKSNKMGSLAYNATCVKQLSCKGKWCKIEQAPLTGWVHNSYLTPLNSSAAQQCY